ncbi:transposase [Phyllobacterium phragmitis]|uniref:transposase n=1 Tax=Phyllobacterium phragmitis TaxID=2670329 RepID=UPI0038B4056C
MRVNPRRSGCSSTGAASRSKKTAHAAEQQRADVLRRRIAWLDDQIDLDPERLIFIDETAASMKMARLRGRAPCGERCRAAVPHGHWKTTTFTAGLRLSGMAAPMLLDGPMNGPAFLAYAEQVLAPELRPGDVVTWTTWRPTRSAACAKPSRRLGRGSCSGHSAQPTSTRVWMAPAGQGVGSDLVNRSVAAMYTASECATGSLRALMNIRLENRSHSIERARSASD